MSQSISRSWKVVRTALNSRFFWSSADKQGSFQVKCLRIEGQRLKKKPLDSMQCAQHLRNNLSQSIRICCKIHAMNIIFYHHLKNNLKDIKVVKICDLSQAESRNWRWSNVQNHRYSWIFPHVLKRTPPQSTRYRKRVLKQYLLHAWNHFKCKLGK